MWIVRDSTRSTFGETRTPILFGKAQDDDDSMLRVNIFFMCNSEWWKLTCKTNAIILEAIATFTLARPVVTFASLTIATFQWAQETVGTRGTFWATHSRRSEAYLIAFTLAWTLTLIAVLVEVTKCFWIQIRGKGAN